MKKTFIVSLFAAVAVLGITGCASNQDQQAQASQPPPPPKPAKDKRPKEDRLKVGMTQDEVRTAIGNPRDTSMNSDGSQSWMYNDAEKAFIPYYTLSGGKFHNIVVIFDTDGKVKSWSSNTSGGY
jgi:outer membrane protein assembly factor BamE (lipoprotein component of BamABCDE complex)